MHRLRRALTALGWFLFACSPTGPTAPDEGRSFLPGYDASDGRFDAIDVDETEPSEDAARPDEGVTDSTDVPPPSDVDVRQDVPPSSPPDADPSGDSGEPPPPRSTIAIATFNTEFLFDTVCDSGACGPSDFERVYSPAQFRFKVRSIAEGIEDLQADIVLLQEVENRTALNGLLEELGPAWTASVVTDIGLLGAANTALIARGDLVGLRTHRDRVPLTREDGRVTSFARELLEADIRIHGEVVTVFNAHFRSQRNDDAERRYEEARASRLLVDERYDANPERLIVFGGDLNDAPGSTTLRLLEERSGLFRVASELGDRDGTFIFQGEPVFIDHLYVPGPQRDRYIPGTARIVRDANGTLGGSDHAGLRAEFERRTDR